jgi:hypothetical protein
MFDGGGFLNWGVPKVFHCPDLSSSLKNYVGWNSFLYYSHSDEILIVIK